MKTKLAKIFLLMVLAVPAQAQNKVVIIPLGADGPALSTGYEHRNTVTLPQNVTTEMNSVSITVTQAGTIIANATAALSSSNGAEIGCGIYSSTTLDNTYANYWEAPVDAFLNATIASVRHFSVSAGTHTIYHLCRPFQDASALKRDLSLLFVPD